MEDLFSDLSSISDCDEECLLNLSSKKSKSFFLSISQIHVTLEIPPAFELEEIDYKSTRSRTLEEKNCETDEKWEDKFDKWVQTDEIVVESQSSLADLPPTTREATYSESALERVLRHISAHLHRVQLQQWLAEQPEKNASFHIKPVQTNTIYKAAFNEEKNIFILLLHIPKPSQYFIELRSLKNLLRSVSHPIQLNFFGENDEKERIRLFTKDRFVALYNKSKIIVMEIENLEEFRAFETHSDIVSLFVLNGELHFINSSGIITNLQDMQKILESSPLLHPILSCSVIDNRCHVASPKFISNFSPDSPLDYESYECGSETLMNRGDIRKFGDHRLMIFDVVSQICSIWETDQPKSPSHQLCFAPTEVTVDMTCDEENLYSLTAQGVISLWKLRPDGRKYRDRVFTTFLPHCSKLLVSHPQKFVLQTASEVHFLVFGTAEPSD